MKMMSRKFKTKQGALKFANKQKAAGMTDIQIWELPERSGGTSFTVIWFV